MRHALYCEVTRTTLDIGNDIFSKSFVEATISDYIENKVYFDALFIREEWLRVFETNQREAADAEREAADAQREAARIEAARIEAAQREAADAEREAADAQREAARIEAARIEAAQREAIRLDLTRKLDTLYNATDIVRLIQNIPDAVFTPNGTRRVSETTLQGVVRRIFADWVELDAPAEARKIWLAIYEEELPEVLNPDDTPDFTINPQRVLVVNNARSEFYPFKYIFVRECYESLLPKIINTASNTIVALIGDPGIGKSTFLRFVFAKIIADRNGPQKVFWEMESGFWRYFDGVNRHCGSGDSDLWLNPDVLLLLDGTFRPKHLHKTKNVVLFCSPQQRNYDRMIKASSGAIFIMPCWDIEEVNTFCNITIENETHILSETMQLFYRRLLDQLAPLAPQAVQPLNVDSKTSLFLFFLIICFKLSFSFPFLFCSSISGI